MERNHQNYFGQTADVFTILGEFELRERGLRFAFETFSSIAAFDAGAQPLDRLRKEFSFVGESLEDFKSVNESVISAISETALNILGVGGRGWTLQHLYLSTVGKAIVISAIDPAGDEFTTITKQGGAFDAIVEANLDLIAQAIGLTWSHGENNDDFLSSMTPTTEFRAITKQ